MIFYNNFQRKVRNIIKKIENGSAGESNISSLCELLEDHTDMMQESLGALNIILVKGNVKAYNCAISALNNIAEKYIGFEHYSVDVIVNCMQERKNDLREDSLLKLLEILSKLTQKSPERMKIAVPEMFICLENTNPKSRETAHFILSIIAATHHEFFEGHSRDIKRVLNGLYVDERIYACRLLKQLAQNDQTIVNDMHDLLEDLMLNHPDCNLRLEAGFAMDRLKEGIRNKSSEVDRPPKLIKPGTLVEDKNVIPEDFSGLSELIAPNKKDMIDILEGMNLKHLIINR
ncbi:MAG: hypothetical protein OIN83_12415 [Candidatus Methanoperedens sp.]|nr:hypothetical protein [Candidatus Methanoperedens sp.]